MAVAPGEWGRLGREDRLARAADSVAQRFSRQMAATTTPWGALTDPVMVGIAVSVLAVVAAVLYATVLPGQLELCAALASLPLLVALVAYLGLMGQRRKLCSWLAELPFPVENMNALLNGVAQNLEVRFAGEPPGRDAFNARLEQVHEDCFALEYAEDEPVVPVRIGVLDSKLDPAGAHHRRYRRVVALCQQALGPLHATHPIRSVWIA